MVEVDVWKNDYRSLAENVCRWPGIGLSRCQWRKGSTRRLWFGGDSMAPPAHPDVPDLLEFQVLYRKVACSVCCFVKADLFMLKFDEPMVTFTLTISFASKSSKQKLRLVDQMGFVCQSCIAPKATNRILLSKRFLIFRSQRWWRRTGIPGTAGNRWETGFSRCTWWRWSAWH